MLNESLLLRFCSFLMCSMIVLGAPRCIPTKINLHENSSAYKLRQCNEMNRVSGRKRKLILQTINNIYVNLCKFWFLFSFVGVLLLSPMENGLVHSDSIMNWSNVEHSLHLRSVHRKMQHLLPMEWFW